jgi:hypothetical protein
MKLAISDRAWRPHEELLAYDLLQSHGVEGVSLSFHRLEQNVKRAHQSILTVARARKKDLVHHNLKIVCLDQVVDSREGNWKTEEGRIEIFNRFHRALEICQDLGVEFLNITCPSLVRNASDIDIIESLYLDWQCLCDKADQYGISLFVEPVARIYGSRFWQDAQSVSDSFERIGVDMSVGLDTTALSFEVNPRSSLIYWSGQSPVFSVSEPALSCILPRGPIPHQRFSQDLSRLAHQGRVPEWLMVRVDRSVRHPMDSLNDNLVKVRVLYASAFNVCV